MSDWQSSKLRSKVPYFCLEGLNSLGAAFYFNYFFFFLNREFRISTQGNLAVAALFGFVYMFFSRWAGKVTQRRGYVNTFRTGCLLVALALFGGSLMRHTFPAQVIVFVIWTIGMCLTWPPLQALVTDQEPQERTAQLVGVYNLVWAGSAAVANFFGGAVFEKFGSVGLFCWPAGCAFAMAVIVSCWRPAKLHPLGTQTSDGTGWVPAHTAHLQNRQFLMLSRLANPFAYVGISTVVPMIPHIAQGLYLTPTQSGWVNSVWQFARWGAFLLLWRWVGWHYRLRWLFASYVALLGGFLVVILADEVWQLVIGQLAFGIGVGLIYSSSLFYSMDAGNAKGEHGGLHESAIGVGTFIGPAIGALAIQFAPHAPHATAWAVGTALLLGGFALAAVAVRSVRSSSMRDPTSPNC